MSRIDKLFNVKNKRILNIYCTAGYPKLNSTMEVLGALQLHGADMIELGMPYSDPLADGEVIQKSSSVAIQHGMTIAELFAQLKVLRKNTDEGGIGNQIPVILMGYMNPIIQYGFERFCADAVRVGIDGLILPDLPVYEFETIYGPVIKKAGLDFIFLITPETPEERIHKLDNLSSGFLYAVSSSSTTGGSHIARDLGDFGKHLGSYNLKNPVLIGFGINHKAAFNEACQYANGAIIGSAYIKALENCDNIANTTKDFLKNILQ